MTIEMNHRPTREEINAAAGKFVADVIQPPLKILFCGINPGLYSAAIGHHFGRPGNRFWPAIYGAGISYRLLSPYEEHELLVSGCGITNFVSRATASADEITPAELIAGEKELQHKVIEFQPQMLAVLGVSAYRTAFRQPRAVIGQQKELIRATIIWVLPNPSGLNAHYQLESLSRLFHEMKVFSDGIG